MMTNKFFLILLLVVFACGSKNEDCKNLYLLNYDNSAFPILVGGRFGAVKQGGDTIIKPIFDYIQPLNSSYEELRIFKDSSFVDIIVADLMDFTIDSFYRSDVYRSTFIDSSLVVNYKDGCKVPEIADLSSVIKETDDLDYVFIESYQTCKSGVSLRVKGDDCSYIDSAGTMIAGFSISGASLFLAHQYGDYHTRDSLFNMYASETRDSLFSSGLKFYKYLMPTMFQDIKCEQDSLGYNFYLCQKIISL